MNGKLKAILVTVPFGLMLGGCEEITDYFLSGNPAEVSSCSFIDSDVGLEGALCVECNSGSNTSGEASACGTTLKVRCNSNLDDDDDVFGVAIGGYEGATVLTGTAWVDSDSTEGPSVNDELICHEQSVEGFGKQEWKCTNALKGNGKDATTFEAEVKYDPAKDDCS